MRCAWRAERALVAAALALLGNVAAAQGRAWVATQADNDTAAQVMSHLEHKDCAGAARTLDGGVKQGHPTVLLMAGVMFEEGLCVKPNWERALGYCEQSHAAGHPRAAARMASGFATTAAGPDRAAALWWAQRSGQRLTKDRGGGSLPLEDADAFVKVLSAWPPGRLDACTHVAGVVGMLQGDTEFPSRAATFGMRGSVQMVFSPALPGFEVRGTDIGTIGLGGLVNGDAVRDDRPSVRNEFVRYMQEMTQHALRRFPKPEAISSNWTITLDYRFDYE